MAHRLYSLLLSLSISEMTISLIPLEIFLSSVNVITLGWFVFVTFYYRLFPFGDSKLSRLLSSV